MKQGTFLLLSRKKLSTPPPPPPPPPPLSRASTGRHGRKRPGSLPHSLADRSVPHLPAGEYIKTWRRRWFILKQGKIFWFKTEEVGPSSIPRGVVDISRCLSIKGAEDVINRAHAFELSTHSETMFFIADSDKEKEEWISSVGRAIVRQSKSVVDDYGSY